MIDTPSGPTRRPGRVLVIDDEHLLGSALRRTLSDRHHVVVETRGAAALARLQRGERFDVILCDLMMPVMDGIEFHRQLTAIMPDEASRVVFVTGGAFTVRVDSFFRRVPNLLLEKPIDVEALDALIERRIQGSLPSADEARRIA